MYRTERESRFLIRRILRVRPGVCVIGHVEHVPDNGKSRDMHHFVYGILRMRRTVHFVFLKIREDMRLYFGGKPVSDCLCRRIVLRTEIPMIGRDWRGRGDALGLGGVCRYVRRKNAVGRGKNGDVWHRRAFLWCIGISCSFIAVARLTGTALPAIIFCFGCDSIQKLHLSQ